MKPFACVILLLVASNFLLQSLGLIQTFLDVDQINESINNYIYIADIVIGLGIGIYWDTIKIRSLLLSEKAYKLVQRIIRFCLAYSISNYGFAKIFKTQFNVPENIKDLPIGSLDGFWLTWYYFGYSYSFSLIIAAGQIGGSILLLFNRTRLLGTFILLPIMISIVFVNVFYNINFGAFLNSLIYTTGLLFLLLLNYSELRDLFFSETLKLPTFQVNNLILKNTFRIATILSSFGVFFYLKSHFEIKPIIKGVYQTQTITKNNQMTDQYCIGDSVLTKIYFDYSGTAILEFNDQNQRQYRKYVFNDNKSEISMIFQKDNKADTLKAEFINPEQLEFYGVLKFDTVKINLTKLNR